MKRFDTKITKTVELLFIAWERFLLRLCVRRKIKILFSNAQDWEPGIRNGFRSAQHELTFKDIYLSDINSYDLVVPLNIRDLKYLNEVRHLIVRNPIPIPSTDSIELCDDKLLFNQTLISKGFGEFIPKINDTQRYPYILKKRSDVWGVNSHIIHDAQQEQAFADILNHPDYFCQELIFGSKEYATHILFVDQKILCSINIQYTFSNETPIKGKDNVSDIRICGCPYLNLFSSILTSIGFEGLCCINYKAVDGHPFIFEINPRFGGSLSPYFFSLIRHLNL